MLKASIEEQDDDHLLKTFIDLGDHCPKYLRPQLESIIELSLTVSCGARLDGSLSLVGVAWVCFFLLKVMETKELVDSWKQLALELLVTIAENAPAMMRKHTKFLPKIGADTFFLHVHTSFPPLSLSLSLFLQWYSRCSSCWR